MWIVGWYAAASVVTFFVYAFDKSAARRGAWRTPERTLHLLAQQLLLHKTAKLPFRITFWITVLLNVAGSLWVCSPAGRATLNLEKSQPGFATKSIAGCAYSTGASDQKDH